MEILYSDKQIVACIKPVGQDSEHDMPQMLKEALGNTENLHIEILSVPPVEGALQKARELWKEECQI